MFWGIKCQVQVLLSAFDIERLTVRDFLTILDSCHPRAFFLTFSASFIKSHQLHILLNEIPKRGYKCRYRILNVSRITGVPVTERMAKVVPDALIPAINEPSGCEADIHDNGKFIFYCMANAARVTYPAALQRCKLDAPLLAAGSLILKRWGNGYYHGARQRRRWLYYKTVQAGGVPFKNFKE